MKSILEKVSDVFKRYGCRSFHCFRVLIAWNLRFFKTRFQGWKKRAAREELEKAYGRLGAEVFSLYKNEQVDWSNSQLVQQYLKVIDNAELRVFKFDDAIDRINADYLKKKQDITGKCSTAGEEPGE